VAGSERWLSVKHSLPCLISQARRATIAIKRGCIELPSVVCGDSNWKSKTLTPQRDFPDTSDHRCSLHDRLLRSFLFQDKSSHA